jgi:hypothetical protein
MRAFNIAVTCVVVACLSGALLLLLKAVVLTHRANRQMSSDTAHVPHR